MQTKSPVEPSTRTVPPSGVNFKALLSRLYRICLNRTRSAYTEKVSSACSMRIFLAIASGRITDSTSGSASETLKVSRLSSSNPDSIFDRSRMSLISCSRWRAPFRTCPTKRCCLSVRSPAVFSAKRSEKPMIAFSGVRSSWLILARNWLFSWVARSTSRFWRSSSLLAAASWAVRASTRSSNSRCASRSASSRC